MSKVLTKEQAIAIREVDGEPTMSSLRIAEVTGKEHSKVIRDIKNVLNEAEISPAKFGVSYSSRGKRYRHYLLPEREFNLVVSGYSAKYRLKLIDDWNSNKSHNTGVQVSKPLSKIYDSEPKMSTLRIAEVTGKTHDNVLRDVRNILDNCRINVIRFEEIYLDGRNRRQTCYMLPEREFMLVISGYSERYRLQLIDELMSYRKSLKKNTPAIPNFSDPVAAARAWADAKEKEQEAKQLAIKHKTRVDNVIHQENTYTATQVAKDLSPSISAKMMNKILSEAKVVYWSNNTWVLYSKYDGYGLMDIKEKESADGHSYTQSRWTTKGKDWLMTNFKTAVDRCSEETRQDYLRVTTGTAKDLEAPKIPKPKKENI